MVRYLKICSLMILFFIASTNTAWCCLNDLELPQREREFRSDYHVAEMTQPEQPVVQRLDDGGLLRIGGVVLLIGTFGMLYHMLRNKSSTNI